jgi:hypothetical protein
MRVADLFSLAQIPKFGIVLVLVVENPDRFAIRLSAVRFGYLSEGDFSTDLDLVQEVGRLINGLIRSLSAPATSH